MYEFRLEGSTITFNNQATLPLPYSSLKMIHNLFTSGSENGNGTIYALSAVKHAEITANTFRNAVRFVFEQTRRHLEGSEDARQSKVVWRNNIGSNKALANNLPWPNDSVMVQCDAAGSGLAAGWCACTNFSCIRRVMCIDV